MRRNAPGTSSKPAERRQPSTPHSQRTAPFSTSQHTPERVGALPPMHDDHRAREAISARESVELCKDPRAWPRSAIRREFASIGCDAVGRWGKSMHNIFPDTFFATEWPAWTKRTGTDALLRLSGSGQRDPPPRTCLRGVKATDHEDQQHPSVHLTLPWNRHGFPLAKHFEYDQFGLITQ